MAGAVLRRGASSDYRAVEIATSEPHVVRELAATIPFDGPHPGRSGQATDRNVQLLITPPFPLARRPGL